MKYLLFISGLLISSLLSHSQSQWQGTNPIYYNGGNVGIGTASPAKKLHIEGAGNNEFIKLKPTTTGYSAIALYNSSDSRRGLFGYNELTNRAFFQIDNNERFDILTGEAERLTVLGSGYVGIGTTNPTRQLDVIGSSIFQSTSTNASVRMKPQSSTSNSSNQVVDFYENYDISNSAAGLVGLANTTWAAPLSSFAFVSTKNGTSAAKDMMFWAHDAPSAANVALMIKANSGNIGIGTTDTKGYKLAVNGNAIFTKIKVLAYENWADYVFYPSYRLRPLSEVEQYIQQHHHLPEVPSAAEVKKDGLDLGDNQATLLKKIEELTLYLIEQNKQLAEQSKKLEQQQQQINELQQQISQNKL
jgi:hypothetical protein